MDQFSDEEVEVKEEEVDEEEDSDKEDPDMDKMFGVWLGELDKLTQVQKQQGGRHVINSKDPDTKGLVWVYQRIYKIVNDLSVNLH